MDKVKAALNGLVIFDVCHSRDIVGTVHGLGRKTEMCPSSNKKSRMLFARLDMIKHSFKYIVDISLTHTYLCHVVWNIISKPQIYWASIKQT